MALTRIQQAVLQRYQGYRSQPPTFLGLLRQSWQVEAILIAASALGILYACRSHLYGAACFIGGLLVGHWRAMSAHSGASFKPGRRSFEFWIGSGWSRCWARRKPTKTDHRRGKP